MKSDFDKKLAISGEVGYVTRVLHSVIEVEGLPEVTLGEMVQFESGQLGQVTSLKKKTVEVLALAQKNILVGTRVAKSGRKIAIQINESILGKTIDVLGNVVIGENVTGETTWLPVDVTPLGISHRAKINKPLWTGVMLVDLMVPVGRGQRELVIGDRKTGKSNLVLTALLSAAKTGIVCIYAAVGRKRAEIMKTDEFFKKMGIIDKTLIVAASSQDSPAEVYLCPYTAMAIAEYFRDRGQDVLLVLDDMTTHAKFYRELSLISRKFPGRDSYPGDIFHVHSKLLERAGNFKAGDKEVSITCLPVVETVQGDITGYIQTNMMSMTDGHIYFDSDLFFKGRRPAINPFVSVTRVGHQTQSKLRRDTNQTLLDLLNNYERTQSFLKFGAELGENSRQVLALGDALIAFFNQPLYSVVPANVQVVLLAMLISGLWHGQNMEKFIQAYAADPALTQVVDSLATTCDTMKRLIEDSRKKADALVHYFQ